jgi:sporulation protein YlmC with PRC-barrel domain
MEVLKYTIAKQMSGKKVFTNRGEELGKLIDLLVDEKSGDIEDLLVEISPDSRAARKLGITERLVRIPYAAVTAVSDVVIVDEGSVRAAE